VTLRATDRSRRLGETSIPRLLLQFSLPAIVGMISQALYNLIDRVFVGQALGPNGIAGITVALPFMLVILACAMLIGLGTTALVSIRLGEQRPQDAQLVLGHAVLLMMAVSVILTVTGLVFLDPLLRIFGASEQVLPFGRDYLRVIVLGSTFQVFSFGLNAVIRGEGNPRVAMLTLLFGVALNALLAPLFVFGFQWGMQGAGLATVCAQAASTTWVLYHFLSGRSVLRLHLTDMQPSWPIFARILAVGSPHFVMQLAASVMNSILNNQLQRHGGDLAISVMGVLYAVAMMIFMPIFGINQGAQPIIGYNYGARRFDRVKTTWQLTVAVATTVALAGFVLMMFFPAYVIRLFNPHDEQLLTLGCHAMRMAVVSLPLVGFQIVSACYFQAVGKPRQAVFLMASRQLLLLIPAVLLLPRFLGLDGVWLALPAADLGATILTAICIYPELKQLSRRS
jgi:putative MATE family efflux protein